MKIGYVIQNQGPDALAQMQTMAPIIESLGFHSTALTDHVIGVRAFAEHGYGAYWLESLAGLAWIAAQTTHLRLGTSILVAAYRDPVYAAKALSTIDNLSGGRLFVGLGVGWSKAEFHALGRGHLHEKRGAVNDAALELILRCWQGGAFDWSDEFFNFRQIQFEPVPVQTPHPPILIGGPPIAPVARRLKKYGMIWHPSLREAHELKPKVDALEAMIGERPKVIVRIRVEPDFDEAWMRDALDQFEAEGCVEALVDVQALTAADAARQAERTMKAWRKV